jgi:hypothetical protein
MRWYKLFQIVNIFEQGRNYIHTYGYSMPNNGRKGVAWTMLVAIIGIGLGALGSWAGGQIYNAFSK